MRFEYFLNAFLVRFSHRMEPFGAAIPSENCDFRLEFRRKMTTKIATFRGENRFKMVTESDSFSHEIVVLQSLARFISVKKYSSPSDLCFSWFISVANYASENGYFECLCN